jgi:hypothetical protein
MHIRYSARHNRREIWQTLSQSVDLANHQYVKTKLIKTRSHPCLIFLGGLCEVEGLTTFPGNLLVEVFVIMVQVLSLYGCKQNTYGLVHMISTSEDTVSYLGTVVNS